MPRSLAILLVVCSGCASTLSTLQTAQTTPRGHAELHAGVGAFAPTAAIPHLARAARLESKGLEALATTGSHPTPPQQERDELLDTALSLALQTPGPVWEIGGRYGLTDFWDVGARLSSNDWAVDTKLKFLDRELQPGVSHAAALDLRYAHVDVSNPVVDVLDYVNMGDFSRFDVEATGLYTLDFQHTLRLYGGPKVVYTRFHFDENAFKFGNEATAYANLPPLAGSLTSLMWFFGGVGGISATYQRVTGYLELNAGWTRLRPELLGQRRELSGMTLYPAAGVAVGF